MRNSPTFFGIFKSPREIKDENPWISEDNIKFNRDKLDMITESEENTFMPISDFRCHPILPCFIANLLSELKICKVLDFAGGAGVIYHLVCPYLLNPHNVFWEVVDNKVMVDLGLAYLSANDNIKFMTTLPKKQQYDIIYINTALQYFMNYQDVLQTLLEYTPQYFILTRLMAGEIETYITSQVIFGKTIPCKIINVYELINFFSNYGYNLIFKSPAIEEDFAKQFTDTIPKSMHLQFSINLIFKMT